MKNMNHVNAVNNINKKETVNVNKKNVISNPYTNSDMLMMKGGLNTPNFNVFNVRKERMMEAPSFNEMLETIADLSKDHSGSRLVQKKYEDANEEDRNQMFVRLSEDIYILTKDVFGNYVIQKLIEHSNNEKRKIIFSHLEGHIHELTLHMYGCRVIQKLIEYADDEDVKKNLNELRNNIYQCIQDQNGNHVIQKLIEKLPKGDSGHSLIVKIITGRICELSTHQYGCRVIQRIFEFCSDEEKEQLLSEIYKNIPELCQDQFGNYVIQHLLEKQDEDKVEKIFDCVRGKVFEMSIHKFAR
jgi:transcriptional regulator CtsR